MKFTDSHEWITLEEGSIARMGISPYAQKELGDIVYVELPKMGKHVQAKQEIAVLESTKAAADIYSPVTGEVVEVNSDLQNFPEWINQSPLDKGWICKIKVSDTAEIDLLMTQEEYEAMLNGA